MSEVSREKAFDRAVDLVIHVDHIVQGWVQRFMLIEAGLAMAVGTILGWKGSQPDAVILTLVVLLAAFAVVFAILIPVIMERLLRWQAHYIKAVKRAEGNKPYLYQPGYRLRGPTLRIAFIFTGAIVAVVWIGFLATLVTQFQPSLEPRAMSLWFSITALAASTVALVLSAFAIRRRAGKPAKKPLRPMSEAERPGPVPKKGPGASTRIWTSESKSPLLHGSSQCQRQVLRSKNENHHA
jgi:hypothetical protein